MIAFLSTREAWRVPAIIVMGRDRRSQRPAFIYETCTNIAIVRLRGRAPRAERLVDYTPHGHSKTITSVGGLRQRGMTATFVIEGAMNGSIFLA